MNKLFSAILLGTLFLSCGSEQTTEDTEENTTDSTETTLVWDKNDYQNDWIEIRESILAADTSTLEKFIQTPDTDAESLIILCDEGWVKAELMDKPYSEIPEVDYNGELVKEFSAEIIEQIDGEEYGSAIYIYMKETKEGLRISGLMAAG